MARHRIEVLTRAPTEFFHCTHCEVAFREVGIGREFRADQRKAALPRDLQEEFALLSDQIVDLVRRHGDRVQIDVVDVASIEGFFKALRRRASSYPTIVLDGDVIYRPGPPTGTGRRHDEGEERGRLVEAFAAIERRLARDEND